MIAGFQLMRILIVLIWCRTALVVFRRVAEWTFGLRRLTTSEPSAGAHPSVTTNAFPVC